MGYGWIWPMVWGQNHAILLGLLHSTMLISKPFRAPKKLNLDIFEKNMQQFPPWCHSEICNFDSQIPKKTKMAREPCKRINFPKETHLSHHLPLFHHGGFISWPALDTLHVILLVGTILKKLANSLKDVSGRLSDRSCWWTLSTWDWNKSTSRLPAV